MGKGQSSRNPCPYTNPRDPLPPPQTAMEEGQSSRNNPCPDANPNDLHDPLALSLSLPSSSPNLSNLPPPPLTILKEEPVGPNWTPQTLIIPPITTGTVFSPQPQGPQPQPSHPVGRPLRRITRDPNIYPPIKPPFIWATDRRAIVHTLSHLLSNNIGEISGDLVCRRCEARYTIHYNLERKFAEVAAYIRTNNHQMHDRAPPKWMNPIYPDCRMCGQEKCTRPVMPQVKQDINWLFLLLGQMLGACTLDQLKWFCKYSGRHRTGAKDRVLYLTYIDLCKQLDPGSLPFDL